MTELSKTWDEIDAFLQGNPDDTAKEALKNSIGLRNQSYSEIEGVLESEDGFYNYANGAWIAYANYITVKYDIINRKNPLYATSLKVQGTVIALAVYFDYNGSYLGYEFRGTTSDVEYSRQLLTPTEGTRYIALVNVSTVDIQPTLEELVTDETSYLAAKSNTKKSKKILILGTSVTFGSNAIKSYIQESSNNLGFELINASVPGQAIHAQDDGEGGVEIVGSGSTVLSISEYAALGTTIASAPEDYEPGGTYNNYYRTWENIFTEDNADVDLWLFDVSPNNDNFITTDDWDDFNKSTWAYGTGTFADHRKTFYGAMLFLMDKMYAINPFARMAFVISSAYNYYEGLTAINTIASQWKIPVIDIWGKINTSPKSIEKIYSEAGTNPHPSTFAHEKMGEMFTNELLMIS